MGKSARTPVLAAGGIVIRNGGKPLVAIVQRRRDNAWVLPKGKLKPNEKPIAAARREATEETGADVRVHEFLGVISYVGGSGPKIAHFWRMQAIGGPAGKPMDDIKAVEWLPLAVAIERLSLPHEQFFLRNVGRKALNRTQKKTRRRPPVEEAVLHMADIAPAIRLAIAEQTPPPAATASPEALAPPAPQPVARVTAVPRVKLVKPQPRWEVLTRLTKRWQLAVGRTRRIG
jgi:8-oxo-dGTP diphosphatase